MKGEQFLILVVAILILIALVPSILDSLNSANVTQYDSNFTIRDMWSDITTPSNILGSFIMCLVPVMVAFVLIHLVKSWFGSSGAEPLSRSDYGDADEEEAPDSFTFTPKLSARCGYCGGEWKEDSQGRCSYCGGSKKIMSQ
jgi:hypothetical protein